jgi:Domain of unknown function (DUF6458)
MGSACLIGESHTWVRFSAPRRERPALVQPAGRQPKEGDTLGIGGSIFLIALGAILAFGVNADLGFIDISVVGVVLMLAGLVLLFLTTWFWQSRRRTVVADPPVRETRVVEPRVPVRDDRVVEEYREVRRADPPYREVRRTDPPL